MTIFDYLSHASTGDITEKLKLLDKSIKELHEHGYYVVCNIADIEIINDEVLLSSFKNKVDYMDSGINENGFKQDILELCAIGVSAYNNFNKYYSSREFIAFLIENLPKYLDSGKVPNIMKEYYIDVFERGNINYLCEFLEKNAAKINNQGNSNNKKGPVKSYSTAVGRAFANRDNESAYANVLLLPAMVVLIYLLCLVGYYLFFR